MSAPFSIAQLNDMLRSTYFTTGRIFLTNGIASLPEAVRGEVLRQVQSFEDFTPDNDPHGEHDFGAIDVAGAGKVLWKIDYYDPSLTRGSDDPADPAKTERVLTIMLASEY